MRAALTPSQQIKSSKTTFYVVSLMLFFILINADLHAQCTIYNVSSTGSTTICSGTTGPTITLDNSVTGVSYQLKRGTTNVGSAKAGTTGTALSWTNNSTAGTYTVTASKSTAPTCSATMNGSVVVTVNALPTAPTVTGASRCGSGTLSLTASSTVSGIFNLYAASTGGTPLQSNGTSATSYTFTTPSLSATTVYYITFSNGTCESSPRKSVTATVNTVPTITSVNGGSTCGTGTVPIQVNGSAAGTFKLYAALTGGSALSTSPTSLTSYTFTSPSISATKTYYVTETVNGCESTPRTSVVATVAPPQTFTVSGGGGLTSQNTTVTINLSGSQPLVNYQLKLNGVSSGAAVAGNSSPLSWTVSTPGTYSVDAQLGTCTTAMGSVIVSNGYVDDALEYAALKDLFQSTNNGTGWTNKTNWPTSWPASASSAEFGTWFGIDVWEGDVVNIRLAFNNLTGTIPASMGNFTQLGYVGLNSNNLSGGFPYASLSNAHGLQYLYVDHNQLSGPLPEWSGTNHPYMQYFNLSFNQFAGPVPASYTSYSYLDLLDLASNQLTSFPSAFASMTWLKDLRLSNNPFTAGPIPSWIGDMTGLQTLKIGGNNFTGTIPSSLGNLHNLAYLELNGNQLTGGLEGLKGCTSMAALDLLSNQLNDLSTDLSAMTQLGYLGLSNNQFQGPIPEWFGNLPALYQLYMNGNQFTSLPSSFKNLVNMKYLYLQDNQFKGNLPDVSRMTSLSVVNVARNQFTGPLPASISIPNITFFDASQNQLSGPFPSISNWTNITSLTITGNKFSGEFPDATGLNKLTFLEATSNQFTSFPTSVLRLPLITYISFQANQVTKIDNLDAEVAANSLHPPSGLGILFIDHNQLDFTTIGQLSNLNYPLVSLPQNDISDVKTIGFKVNNSFSIPSRPLQSTTTISWEKNTGGAWSDVTATTQDATHKSFQRSSAVLSDAGTYRWKMTDTQFPGKEIKSASIELKSNTQIAIETYAFQYRYDGRKRMTHKKVPGADWVYMVYDDRDRLVMSQDGEQRKNNKWTFTKYDALNRPVINGTVTDSQHTDQGSMQQAVNNFYANLTQSQSWFETFSILDGNVMGYDNKSFPTITNNDPLSVTYYDNYDFKSQLEKGYDYIDAGMSPQISHGDQYSQNEHEFLQVIGQVTGTRLRNLSSGAWMNNVIYYDDKYRTIQTVTDNELGGRDYITNIVDFIGQIVQTKTIQHKSNLQWKDKVGVETLGSTSLLKTGSGGWGSAGAASVQMLPAGTDGWVEFSASELSSYRMIGFSTSNPNASYATINYSLYQRYDRFEVWENNNYRNIDVPLSQGDVLRVERKGPKIGFYKNNALIFNSENPTNEALLVDVALGSQGATLQNIRTSFTNETSTITRTFTYDHAGRLLTTSHSINGATPVLLAKNEYNELGQLIDKNLHSTDAGTTFKQSTDYRYNIRGWLTSINNASLTTGAGTNNVDDTNVGRDLFGMELAYEKPVATLTDENDLQFNGNISAIMYSKNLALGDIKSNGYKFGYDAMNRLQESHFRQKKSGGWDLSEYTKINAQTQELEIIKQEAFSETGFDYDLNGNIKALQRSGLAGAQKMDDLDYLYEGNQLFSVNEKTGADKAKGFVDGNVSGNDYAYDANGNMISDANKGITEIVYNHLNLPSKVYKSTGEYITYNYDAAGRKLSQLVFNAAGEVKKKSDYAGEYFYENDTLKFINHEEGRVVVNIQKGYPDRIVHINGSSTSDFILNVSIPATFTTELREGETYLKVESPHLWAGAMTHAFAVEAGQMYKLRIKGYTTRAGVLSYIMKGDGTDLSWAVSSLPVGAQNEGWVEETFTVPEGTNQVYVGALFNYEPLANDAFFINAIEVYKLSNLPAVVTNEYQYHLKDHLGNVRTTFTTKEEIEETTATLEEEFQNTERSEYVKYDDTRRVFDVLFDHTNGDRSTGSLSTPGYSLRLNGSVNERNGLARSLSVMPGDKIDAQVFGKFIDPTGYHSNATLFANLLSFAASVGATGSAVRVDGIGYSSSSLRLPPYEGVLTDPEEDTAFPKAHLNWAIFDRDHNFLDGGARQLKGGAEDGTDVLFGKISASIDIKEPGLVYIWLSNTSAAEIDVFFDDFKVVHTKSPVVQQDEYYPFGLTFNNYQRENSTKNKYLYNSKELQDELNVGWMDYGARMYSPEIGRWSVIDPISSTMEGFSPYGYAYNNPVSLVDVMGLSPAYNWETKRYEDNGKEVTFEDAMASVSTEKNNVLVVRAWDLNVNNKNDAIRYMYRGAFATGSYTIFVGNKESELVENMQSYVDKHGKIDNLIIANHSSYDNPFMFLGETAYLGSDLQGVRNSVALSKISSMLNSNATVFLHACFVARPGSDGEEFLKTVALKLKATVIGSQGEGKNLPNMFNGNFSQTWRPDEISEDDRRRYPELEILNGKFTKVTLRNGEPRVTTLYDLRYTKNGATYSEVNSNQ